MINKMTTFTITAIFTLALVLNLSITGCSDTQEYQLILDTKTGQEGAVSGEGSYSKGELVTVTAEPTDEQEFVQWERNSEKISSDKEYQFEIEEDTELKGIFTEKGEGEAEPDENNGEKEKAESDKEIEEGEEAKGEKEEGSDSNDKQTAWDENAVKELAQDAFSIYFAYSSPGYFSNQAREDLEAGKLDLNYPGIQDPRSSEKPYREEIEIEITEVFTDENEAEVIAEISYPHIAEEDFDDFTEKIQTEILTQAEESAVNLEEVFKQVLEQERLNTKVAEKSLTIVQNTDEQNDQSLQVIEIDSPEELLSSFDELYQEAIANSTGDLSIQMQDDKTFNLRKNYLTGEFDGEPVDFTMWSDNTISYFIEDLKIVMPDETELQVTDFWEQLQDHAAYNPYLNFSPQDYFNQVEITETSKEEYKTILLTRPYAAATKDSVIGYVNLDDDEINLFTKVGGPGQSVSDFRWSPQDNYIAYYYTMSGVGTSVLEVYDIAEDEVVSLADLDIIDEEFVGQEPGISGEIQNIQWPEDELLTFELMPMEGDSTTAYEIDLEKINKEAAH